MLPPRSLHPSAVQNKVAWEHPTLTWSSPTALAPHQQSLERFHCVSYLGGCRRSVGILQKSEDICGHTWTIFGNLLKYVEIYVNTLKSYGTTWKLCGNLWNYVDITCNDAEITWKSLDIHANL